MLPQSSLRGSDTAEITSAIMLFIKNNNSPRMQRFNSVQVSLSPPSLAGDSTLPVSVCLSVCPTVQLLPTYMYLKNHWTYYNFVWQDWFYFSWDSSQDGVYWPRQVMKPVFSYILVLDWNYDLKIGSTGLKLWFENWCVGRMLHKYHGDIKTLDFYSQHGPPHSKM